MRNSRDERPPVEMPLNSAYQIEGRFTLAQLRKKTGTAVSDVDPGIVEVIKERVIELSLLINERLCGNDECIQFSKGNTTYVIDYNVGPLSTDFNISFGKTTDLNDSERYYQDISVRFIDNECHECSASIIASPGLPEAADGDYELDLMKKEVTFKIDNEAWSTRAGPGKFAAELRLINLIENQVPYEAVVMQRPLLKIDVDLLRAFAADMFPHVQKFL